MLSLEQPLHFYNLLFFQLHLLDSLLDHNMAILIQYFFDLFLLNLQDYGYFNHISL